LARAKSKQGVSFRFDPRTVERLKQRAHDVGAPQAALAERYIDEGMRVDEHPGIYFREGGSGRRPAVLGTRLDVAQIIETLRQNENSIDATAEYLDVAAVLRRLRGRGRRVDRAEPRDCRARARTLAAPADSARWVRLLLDEMISWRVAGELRSRGHDVVAVKRDRPHLESRVDRTVLEAAAAEQRAVVTNNVRDYLAANARMRARGEDHYGVIYTYDDTLPRNKAAFPLWVTTLEELLRTHPADDALRNRAHHLLP